MYRPGPAVNLVLQVPQQEITSEFVFPPACVCVRVATVVVLTFGKVKIYLWNLWKSMALWKWVHLMRHSPWFPLECEWWQISGPGGQTRNHSCHLDVLAQFTSWHIRNSSISHPSSCPSPELHQSYASANNNRAQPGGLNDFCMLHPDISVSAESLPLIIWQTEITTKKVAKKEKIKRTYNMKCLQQN